MTTPARHTEHGRLARRRDRAAGVVAAMTVLATAGTVVTTVGVAAAMSEAEDSTPQAAPAATPSASLQALRPPSTVPTDQTVQGDRDDSSQRPSRTRKGSRTSTPQPEQRALPRTAGS